jgi:hypothetical protein
MAHLRASALHARGRPLATVREVLLAGLPDVSEHLRAAELLRIDAVLLILAGDLGRSADLLRSAASAVAGTPASPIHPIATSLRVRLALEMGRDDEAIEVTREYLARRDVLARPTYPDDDPIPLLAAVAARWGLCSAAEGRSLREAFLAEWSAAPPIVLWAMAHEPFAPDLDAVAPPSGELPPAGTFVHDNSSVRLAASIGTIARREGRNDVAIAHLRAAVGTTGATCEPLLQIRASHELGLALEEAGDRAGALAAHRHVVARWGAATPRSVTAEASRERLAGLE